LNLKMLVNLIFLVPCIVLRDCGSGSVQLNDPVNAGLVINC